MLFIKQKTAYEKEARDWGADVCSADRLVAMRLTSEDGQNARNASVV